MIEATAMSVSTAISFANMCTNPVPRFAVTKYIVNSESKMYFCDSLLFINIIMIIDIMIAPIASKSVYTEMCCTFSIVMYVERVITVARNELAISLLLNCLNIKRYIYVVIKAIVKPIDILK